MLMRLSRVSVFPLLLVMTLATGCEPQRTQALFREVRGPDARLDGRDIEAFTTRQDIAVAALVRQAGVSLPAPGSRDWNLVALAGLHYVDEKCEVYMQALDEFDRQRRGLKNGVALTGAAAAATMGILDAAAEAIALVGTAFGLTTALIDTGADTLLYSIEPGAVREALARSQRAYRDSLSRRVIDNRPGAMAAVQGYLSLCLPVTLASTINTAVATADIRATETTATNPVPDIRINPGPTAGIMLDRPLPTTAPALEPIRNARGEVEAMIPLAQGRRIQAALCVGPDGNFGPTTREAIRLYRRARLTPAGDPSIDAPLTLAEAGAMLDAGPCAGPAGYRTAYERFRLPTQADIGDLQDALDRLLADRALQRTGRLDAETRGAIRAARRQLDLGDSEIFSPELADAIAG